MSSVSDHIEASLALGPAVRFEHPVSFAGLLRAADVADMAHRALNYVDPRLVDHGLRVATLLDAMLEVDGSLDGRQRNAMRNIALLHDVGAYRTEEIDQLIEFETGDVWEHSFYGYLFIKELSPFSEYAEVVLYHHMPDNLFAGQDPTVRFLAQALQTADRVDVYLMEHPRASAAEAARELVVREPGRLAPWVVDLFLEADRRFGLLDSWCEDKATAPLAFAVDAEDEQAAALYLDMLVHVIDFRSRHTVAHTVTTAWVAYELACRMVPDEDGVRSVYVAALLHDMGKIGVPLNILEKPGRLDELEMAVMRTHVLLSERIIEGCVHPDIVNAAVRHHEKLDGSGYPRGLSGERLTLPDRIIAVADIVSALVGTRSYKEAYSKERVLRILVEQCERGLVDASVVQVMTRDYDDIMREAARACVPVEAIYRRVMQEYDWLLDELRRVTGAPGVDSGARQAGQKGATS